MGNLTTEQSESITQAIVDTATGPKSVSSDQGTVVAHSLSDLIEAERYLASNKAVKKANRGLRFSKFIPPGAV
jgi:hypothetical protein